MEDEPTPPYGVGFLGGLLDLVRSLSLQNLLVFGVLIALSIPSYFAWRFMTDTPFRHEFMSTARIIDAEVPCLVVEGNIQGWGDRHTVTLSYNTVGNWDYSIAIRAPTPMSNQEIRTACEIAHREVELMKGAVADRDAKATEGK